MKNDVVSFSLIALAVMASVTVMSCSRKEMPEAPASASKTGEQVEICLRGDFGDFEDSDTKAGIGNIFRMTWASGTAEKKDTVYVYGKTAQGSMGYLGPLAAFPVEGTDNRLADLKGTITAPASGTKLTFIYSPVLTSAPVPSGDAVSIDLSEQSGKADSVVFVAYTTVNYAGAADTSYRESFKFATGVMRINASNINPGIPLKNVEIANMNTVCKLALSADALPTVTGEKLDTLYKEFGGSACADVDGTMSFYVALPKPAAATCLFAINSGEDTIWCSSFSSKSAKADAIINLTSDVTKVQKYPCGDSLIYGIYVPATRQVWAPVNCGKSEGHPFGLLYQFGRKQGCGYGSDWGGTHPKEDTIQIKVSQYFVL